MMGNKVENVIIGKIKRALRGGISNANGIEERYAKLLGSSEYLFVVLDAQLRIKYASQAALQLLSGNTGVSLINRPLQEFSHSQDQAQILQNLHNLIDHPETSASFSMQVRDYSGKWYSLQTVCHNFLHDKVIRGIVVNARFTDVDSVKRSLSDEEFRDIVENAPDIISKLDRQHRYLYVNPIIEKYSGIKREQYIGKSLRELGRPAEIVSPWEKALEQVFTTGHEVAIEYDIQTPAGTRRIQPHIYPEFDSDGHVRSVISLTRDITLLKESEDILRRYSAELSRLNKKYNSLINATEHVIYEWNAQTHKLEWYGNTESILGYGINEIPTRFDDWIESVHPDDRQELKKHAKQAETTGAAFLSEYRVRKKDGSWIIVEDKGRYYYDDNGSLSGMVGYLTDITVRKRAEDELKKYARELAEWQGRYNGLITASGQIIYYYDLVQYSHTKLEGNTVGILGYTSEYLLRSKNEITNIIHPDDLERVLAFFEDAQIAGGFGKVEYRMRHADGHYILVQDSFNYIKDEYGSLKGCVGIWEDVTDVRKAEDDLKEYVELLNSWKDRYKTLLGASGQIIFDYDAKTKLSTFDGNTEELLGYTAQEISGPGSIWEGMVHPEDRQGFLDSLHAAYLEPKAFSYELRVRRKDGEYITVEENIYFIRDEDGNVIGNTGYISDVSDQRKAEREIKRWNDRYNALVNANRQIIYQWDPYQRVAQFDGSVEEITGFTTEELSGPVENFDKVVHPDDSLRVQQSLSWSTSNKKPFVEEYKIVRKDGRVVDIKDTGYSILKENGEVDYMVGFIMDITDQKKAQAEIEFQALLLDGAEQSIVATDLSGKITYWNKYSENLYGWTRDEIIGRSASETLSQDFDTELRQEIYSTVAQGTSWSGEVVQTKKDGSKFPARLTLSPVYDKEGNLIGRLGINTDITVIKKAEDEIRFQAHLLDVAEEGIIATDLNGNVVYWNKYAEVLFGWTKEEMMGRSARAAIAANFPEALVKEILEKIESTGSYSGEVPETRKDGSVFPARVNITVITDPKGEQIGRLSLVTDLTQSKKIEDALRASERRLRLITANMRDVLYVYDMERKLVYVNSDKAVEYLTNYKSSELRDGNFTTYIYPADRPRVDAMLNEAYAGQTFAREEVRILTKEGKLRWHAFTINPLFDEEGKQLGVEVSERGINRLKMAEFALRESEERYRSLVDLSPDAICLTSLEGNIIIANQQAVKLYNAESVRDLLGKDIAEFITETSHGSLQDQFKFCLQNGRVKGQEYAIRKDDTTQQLVEISVSLIRDMDGYPDGFITVTRDITERKKAERAILETNRKLETLVQATPLAVVALDRHNRVTIWNSAAEKMFGWSSSEVIGKELPYLTADILEEHNSHMTLSVQGETINGAELTRKTKTGETLVISLSTAPLHDSHNNITGYVAVMQDITEKKKIEKQLVDLAFFDQLTGLPNRTLFHDRLSQALSHAQQNDRKVALLFVDLDRFKTINDSLGHVIGDTLLALVGERLNSCVKQNDTVSRQGGDEFTIILTDIAGEKEAATTASKIIDVLEEPFTIESHEVFITPSIGISIYPTDTEEPATMIRFADVAMYSAKRRGGDLFQFYTSDMNARVLERLNVENNLRKAMRREEFVVFYQPKYDLHTGKIVSAESLVRWNSRELGLVSPLRFIPVAEETGMIVEIDTFVMRTACKEAKKWQKAGYPDFRIAVNITPQELTPKLINTVENALNEAGLEPQYLEIEITEGGIMQVDDQILKIISDIRARGVKIAVDDFGTGYSTLSRLKDLEADLVKIDQSFIRNVCTNDRDAAIVSSMVTLAHNLGLKVVAEGVENEQTSNLLKSFGCDEIQGYLISPPVSDDQFPGLLDQYNTK